MGIAGVTMDPSDSTGAAGCAILSVFPGAGMRAREPGTATCG